MALNSKTSAKSDLMRTVRRETEKIEKAQRRPTGGDVKEKRRTMIVIGIGIAGLIGAPIARYTIWRHSYEPTLTSQIKSVEHLSLPAELHQLSSN